MLLGGLVAGWLGACQSHPIEQATGAGPAATTPSLTPEARADALRDSAEAQAERVQAASADAIGLDPLPIPAESLAPSVLESEIIGDRRLRAGLLEGAHTALLLGGRGLQVWEPDAGCSRFYYRAAPTDTVWRSIPLNYELLPCGGSGCSFEVRTFDWDGRPPRELWFTLNSGNHAPAVYEECNAVQIVSVAGEPQELLAVIVEHDLTRNGELRGYTFEPAEQHQRSARRLELRGRDVVLGPIRVRGNYTPTDGAPRMQLPAGRYRYQHGRVVRLKP